VGGRAGGLGDPTHLHARPQWSAHAGHAGVGSRSGLKYRAGEGHFDEFHNQWLTHQHSYQIADLFNRGNITSLNH